MVAEKTAQEWCFKPKQKILILICTYAHGTAILGRADLDQKLRIHQRNVDGSLAVVLSKLPFERQKGGPTFGHLPVEREGFRGGLLCLPL